MYIQKQHWEGTCDRLLIVDVTGCGTVQVDIFHTDKQKEHYRADCLLWGLWVDEDHRKQCVASAILDIVELRLWEAGCKTIALEWNEQESPLWVRDWYERLGYEEKVFGKGYSLMVKELKLKDYESKSKETE